MNRDFVFQSGKIVMHWNPWYGIWEFWEAPLDIFVIIHEKFIYWIGWFSGFVDDNRGRHWDRKNNDNN